MKSVTIFAVLSIVLMMGCRKNRDVSTPEKALIGQWRTAHKKYEINWYFNESGFYTAIWPCSDKGDYKKETAKFIVLTQNAEKKTITVDLLKKPEAFIDNIPSTLGLRYTGKYSEDYSHLEGYFIMIRNPDFQGRVDTFRGFTEFEWEYIDMVPEPELEPDLDYYQSNPTQYPTPDSREFHALWE